MLLDFPTILFLIALFGLGVWIYDFYFNQKARDEANNKAMVVITALEAKGSELTDDEKKEKFTFEPRLVEYSKAFFPILVLVIILRSFFAEPFKIPSDSMVPTLLDGDFIIVNKFSYGFVLPVINKQIINVGTPNRGDVAVFRYPLVPTTNFIKRVIGLPGDRIEYRDKKLKIIAANGKEVVITYNVAKHYIDTGSAQNYVGAALYNEKIGSHSHRVITVNARHFFNCLDDKQQFVVPKGHYFVMGDNRDNSHDSRFWCSVPEENLVGRAVVTWFNVDPIKFNNSFTLFRIGDFSFKPAIWQYVRWSRMFNSIE